MRKEAPKKEMKIRESRENGLPCPFARQLQDQWICNDLDMRCGERMQFSKPFEAEKESQRERPHACMRPSFLNHPKIRVLVADDEEIMRLVCIEYLKWMNVDQFYEAKNESEAMMLLEKQKREGNPIHLVITDIQMSMDEEGGYLLANFIDHRNFFNKVILVSGKMDMENFSTPHSVVTHRIRKPFSMQHFHTAVREALQQ